MIDSHYSFDWLSGLKVVMVERSRSLRWNGRSTIFERSKALAFSQNSFSFSACRSSPLVAKCRMFIQRPLKVSDIRHIYRWEIIALFRLSNYLNYPVRSQIRSQNELVVRASERDERANERKEMNGGEMDQLQGRHARCI